MPIPTRARTSALGGYVTGHGSAQGGNANTHSWCRAPQCGQRERPQSGCANASIPSASGSENRAKNFWVSESPAAKSGKLDITRLAVAGSRPATDQSVQETRPQPMQPFPTIARLQMSPKSANEIPR